MNTAMGSEEDEAMMARNTMEDLNEEQAFQHMHDQGDEDAIFVAEFEEEVINAIQDSSQLASGFSARAGHGQGTPSDDF